MGLIMLILGGTVPTVYALNLAVRYDEFQSFIRISQSMEQVVDSQTGSSTMPDSMPVANSSGSSSPAR